ncbi:MAG: LexA family protein [Holosporales bacterium]
MARGGARAGAGRPKGTGKYGEKTITVRIPASMGDAVKDFVENQGWQIPLYASKVAAGSPCWGDDHVGETLNLSECLVRDSAKTFCVQAFGDSMINAGIELDDILVVDSGLDAKNGNIVVAAVNGDLTVKRLHKTKNTLSLMPENDNYRPIKITAETGFQIWGVVTRIIKAAI